MVEVLMHRDLKGWPTRPAPPPGFTLRWFRPGDERTWLTIQASTGIYDPISPDLFSGEFGDNVEMLLRRQCYVDDARGSSVGTATAWIAAPGMGSQRGRVHWVAVAPGEQRRGLGSFLTAAACHRLAELGARHAYLTTGSNNLPAIQMYLRLGFRPEVSNGRELEAWRELAGSLDPGLRPLLDGIAP